MTVDFLTGRELWSTVTDACRAAKQPVRAAIAYLGVDAPDLLPLGDGDILVTNAGRDALQSGATHPDALATFVERGVDVWSNEWLHAKVLVVGRRAFVGSANASLRSARDLIEAACVLTDPAAVRSARRFVDEMDGCEPVDDSYLAWARATWVAPKPRAQRREGRAGSGVPVPAPSDRVYVLLDAPWHPPPALDRAIEKTSQSMRRRAGPKSSFELDWTVVESSDRLRHRDGDWLVWGEPTSGGGNGLLYPPAQWIGGHEEVTNKRWWIDYWRRSTVLEPWDLHTARGAVLSRTGVRLRSHGWLRNEDAKHELFSWWGMTPEHS